MLFNSLGFALFFPAVYAIYRFLPHRAQNVFLLLASYVFYGSWDWRFLSLIAFSTLVDFYCGARLAETSAPGRRKALLMLSLSANLGLLATFKYFNFFVGSMQSLLTSVGFQVSDIALHIVLPVGISFYTFQTLSYTIDIYRGQLRPEKDLITFALFVAFFPQLVAGPIERASRLLPQLREPRVVRSSAIREGLWLVLWGYFLKTVVADNLAPIANAAFDPNAPADGVAALIGVYAFAFQIFGDFAGYSSIAIGIALLMGVRLSTNFLHPYFVTNPSDFWKNWHISLSTWLRDYLYIPLGGSRGRRGLVYRNLFLTMLLGGLWHGAAWTFVLWGAFHGALLIAHRAVVAWRPEPRRSRGALSGRAWWTVKVIGMFHLTCLGWLIFRAPSIPRAGEMLGQMVMTMHVPTQQNIYLALQLAIAAGLVLCIQMLQRQTDSAPDLARARPAFRLAAALVMAMALLVWGNDGGAAFIYFQF